MSAYDTTASQFIQKDSIAAAVAKAWYLESYKQVIGKHITSAVVGLNLHAKISNLAEFVNDHVNSIAKNIAQVAETFIGK